MSETCESGESDSNIEFLEEIPGTIHHHTFVHRKVKTEVKDIDQKESVDVKIKETRRNLFRVKVSESDCSEVETETSKVRKRVNSKGMKSPKLLANAQSESRRGIKQMNKALQGPQRLSVLHHLSHHHQTP